MSDLAATNCGCSCNEGNGCNIIFLIILLSCICGNNNGGCNGGCLGSGNDNCFWIILLLLFCGNGNGIGNCFSCC